MPSTAGIKAGKAFIVIDAMDMTARAFAGIRRNILSLGTTMTSVGQSIAVNSALLFTPFLAGMKAFSEFDNELRKLVAKSTGRLSDLADMERFVLNLSKQLGVAASEIALSARLLVERGFEGEQLKKVLPYVILLAKAAGDSTDASTDLRHATSTVAGILSAYRMSADKAAEVTDLLASVVNKTNVSLEDMNVVVSYAATVAAEYRVSLEELLAVIGVFRDVNMDASVAATAFRNILLYSTSRSELDKFNEKLKNLTGYVIDFTDEAGRLKSPIIFLTAIGELLKKIPDETIRGELLSDLFGTRSTVPSMQIIKNIDKIAEYIMRFKSVEGTTKRMADFMSSGIGGVFGRIASDISALVASLKVLTPTMEFFGGIIRSVSEWLQAFIGRNSQLIDGIIKLIAISGVFGVSLIVLGKIIRMLGGMFTPVVYVLKMMSTIVRAIPARVDLVAGSFLKLYSISYRLTKLPFGSWLRGLRDVMGKLGDSMTRVVHTSMAVEESLSKLSHFIGWGIKVKGMNLTRQGLVGIYNSVNKAVLAGQIFNKTLRESENVLREFYRKSLLLKRSGPEVLLRARAASMKILKSMADKGIISKSMISKDVVGRLASSLVKNVNKMAFSGIQKGFIDGLIKSARLVRVFESSVINVRRELRGVQRTVSLLGGGLRATAMQLFIVEQTFKKVGDKTIQLSKRVIHNTSSMLRHNKRFIEVSIFGMVRSASVGAAALERAVRSTRVPMLLWFKLVRLVARETGYLRFAWGLATEAAIRFFGAFQSFSGIKTILYNVWQGLYAIFGLVGAPLKEAFGAIWNIIKIGWTSALQVVANWITKIASDPVGFLINAIGTVVAGLTAALVVTATLSVAMGAIQSIGATIANIFTTILTSLPALAEKGLAKTFEVGKRLMELLSTITEYVKIALDMERYDLAAKMVSLGIKIAFYEIRNEFLEAFQDVAAGITATIRLIKELISKVFSLGGAFSGVGNMVLSFLPETIRSGLSAVYKYYSDWYKEQTDKITEDLTLRWKELKDEALEDIKKGDVRRKQELEDLYTELEYHKAAIRMATGRNPELERLQEKYEAGGAGIIRAPRPPARPMSRPVEGYHELPEEIGGGRIWIGRGESPGVTALRNRMLESARRSIRPAEITEQPVKYDVLKAAEARSSEAFRAFFENKMNTDMAKATVERLGEISHRLGPLATMSDDIARIRELMEE